MEPTLIQRGEELEVNSPTNRPWSCWLLALVTLVSTLTIACGTEVARVVVSPNTSAIVEGSSQPSTVTLQDAMGQELEGRTVAWSSSNTQVAVRKVLPKLQDGHQGKSPGR